jgi:lipoprotein signal peptidase
MKEPSYRGLFWGLALFGTLLDQVTKYGIFRWLYNNGHGDSFTVIPGIFELVAHFSGQRDPGDSWLSPLRTWGGEVQPVVNHGALFGQRLTEWLQHWGLMTQSNPWVDNLLFAVVSVLAAGVIVWWVACRLKGRELALCSSLGLILAGTVGNLYDRLVFGGVRDFLHFHYLQAFDWPVFNIADCCLVCGAFLLLAHAFWSQPQTAGRPASKVAGKEVAEV